jgi:Ca2+-transporting ATPase
MQTWHSMSAKSVAAELHTDLVQGLVEEEARKRLDVQGPNELKGEEGVPWWRKLVDQFKDFLVLILLAASLVSFAAGERTDALLIVGIVVVNAVLGFIQEGRAEKALNALKQMAAPHAVVIRGGQTMDIPARKLVPGDVILLEAGSVAPADVRLVQTASLKVEEAALTGESVPVEKDADLELAAKVPLAERSNMAYLGTTVVYGRGQGVVVATGMDTEMGRIAGLLTAAPEGATPLQQRLDALGKMLGLATLVISVLVFITGLVRDGYGVDWLQLFLVAVSLAVAAIPEGLPAVVTIVLALGMQRMVAKNAVVKKLHAVETLGSTTVICTDKTGTLTQNKMAAVALWAGQKLYTVSGSAYAARGQVMFDDHPLNNRQLEELELPLLTAALCNDARVIGDDQEEPELVGDPTEGALLGLAAKVGVTSQNLADQYPRRAEIPFDSRRKLMTTIHPAKDGGYLVLTKGAPDVVLARSKRVLVNGSERELSDDLVAEIEQQNANWAGQALRVLALAYRKLPELPAAADLGSVEEELTLLALVGLKDPLRPEAKLAVDRSFKAGIRTVMITGDHPQTALAIGRELGLTDGNEVLTGADLDELTSEQLKKKVQKANVYARVAPEHKSAIVQALQEQGEIVAVTGDGVNDAPALKRADIGVAMGITGTDVAKGAADMILTDDNFASIVSAVEEGRVIYANIRKFVYFLLSCNVGEVLIVFLAQLMALPLPLLPVHLLWLNLLTDAFPALALGVEQAEPGIMTRPPRSPREPLLDRLMQHRIAAQGVALTVAILGVFWLALPRFDVQVARTMAFATLVVAELLRSFSSRSERLSLLRMGLFTNRTLLLGSSVSLLAFLITIYVPGLRPVFKTAALTIAHWRIIVPAALLPTIVAEVGKVVGGSKPGQPRLR